MALLISKSYVFNFVYNDLFLANTASGGEFTNASL